MAEISISELRRSINPAPKLKDMLEVADFKKTTPEELAAEGSNAASMEFAATIIQEWKGKWPERWVGPTCVYVIAPDEGDVCKIGYATSPICRLSGVQNGNWLQLRLRFLLWGYANKVVMAAERLALDKARQQGIRLKGEWLSVPPRQGAVLLCEAAREVGLQPVTSETLIRNFAESKQSIAKRMRFVLDEPGGVG